MNSFLIVVLFVGLYPLETNTIRCYKCEATTECKTINGALALKDHNYLSEEVEIVDCEYNCWKSISLGNVYRGCARKRCAVSHTMGTFSSNVCCQTDYCNGSNRMFRLT